MWPRFWPRMSSANRYCASQPVPAPIDSMISEVRSEIAFATSTGTTSISAPMAPAASICLHRLEDLHGRVGGLADRLEAAGPGGARRNQADMADDGNGSSAMRFTVA